METTIFLAQVWGPVTFAIGIGMFVSRNNYVRIYRELEKDALAVLLLGITFMAAGIVQISFHNIWNTFPQFLISLLGWGMFLKGVVFVIIPRIAERNADRFSNTKLIGAAGVVVLAIGAYLSWFAYLA